MFTTKWFSADLKFETVYVETIYLPRMYDIYEYQVTCDLMCYRADGTQWSGQVAVDECSEFTETETRFEWMG